MDDWEQLKDQLREEIPSRFPGDSLLDVDFIWRGSGDPESQVDCASALPELPGEIERAVALTAPAAGHGG